MARFRELSSEKLTSIAERSLKQSALTDRDHFYLGSYPFILKHFAALRFDRTKTDSDRFWQALIMVYSWMGRGTLKQFDNTLKRYREICPLLLKVRRTGIISEDDLRKLSQTVCQGSVIATSKLLHFLKPNHFAIWDTRVSRIACGVTQYMTINKPKIYLDYLEWLKGLKIDSRTTSVVQEHLGIRNASPLRVKEFVLFMDGAKSHEKKKPHE